MRALTLILTCLLLLLPSLAAAQETTLHQAELLTSLSPRSAKVARVWHRDARRDVWAGASIDWRSRMLAPEIGLSHTLFEGAPGGYALILNTRGEVLMLAPPQPGAALGMGFTLLNAWDNPHQDWHFGPSVLARAELGAPTRATLTLGGVLTTSRVFARRHRLGLGLSAGWVSAASGTALQGTINLFYLLETEDE